MKLSELIKHLQDCEKQFGPDIECFSSHCMEDCNVRVCNNEEDEYPPDWNMPPIFLVIGETS